MICLCMTNLGDADAKNNPSVMVVNSPKLNYCIMMNVICALLGCSIGKWCAAEGSEVSGIREGCDHGFQKF